MIVQIDEDYLDHAQSVLEDIIEQFEELRPKASFQASTWILKNSGDLRVEIRDADFIDALQRAKIAVLLLAEKRKAIA